MKHLILLIAACGQQTVSLENRPCNADRKCLTGYTCDPLTNMCISLISPAAPYVADLKAVAGDAKVTLTFTTPSEFFQECQVLRKPSGVPAGFDDLSALKVSTRITDAGKVEVVDGGLLNGTQYGYMAMCRVGTSWSDEVRDNANVAVATPLDVAPANPTDFEAGDDEPERSTLQFTMPPAPISECQVRRAAGATPSAHDAGELAGNPLFGPGIKHFTDANLDGGVVYHYAVFCRFGTTWNDTVTDGSSDTATPRVAN